MLIKQVALQTFNNTAPLFDKLRMLMIHIRNSCKMHYQVSLNQNYNKEALDFEAMQDPVEIDSHLDEISRPVEITEKIFQTKFSSVSPIRDNDAQNKLRPRAKNTEKSVSPTNSIEILEKALNYRFSFKSIRNSKNLNEPARRISVSPFRSVSPNDVSKLTEVKKSFEKFRSNFKSTVKTPPRSFTNKRIQAQLNFIHNVRKNSFQSGFVLRMIFSAWKKGARDKLLGWD